MREMVPVAEFGIKQNIRDEIFGEGVTAGAQ